MRYVSLNESLSKLQVVFCSADQPVDADRPARNTTNADSSPSVGRPNTQVSQELKLLRQISTSGVDLISCLTLLLKRQWERHQHLRAPGFSAPGAPDRLLPAGFTEQLGFTPDIDALFKLFREEKCLLESSGYSEQTFRLLCRELTSARLFWGDIDSPELDAFRHREAKTLLMFTNANEADIEEFRRRKLFWLELYDQLGEKILVLEQCKLRNASVNHQFMEAFGEAHLALERQLLRLEEAGLRLEYLQSNPGASRAEIEIAIADRVSQQHEQLRRLKHDVFMAPYLKKPMSSTSIGENDFLNHRAQVKRRLLEIRMILHPDRLVQHPGFPDLSDVQKDRLAALWHELKQISPDEIGYADDQLGALLRSLTLLENILNEAKAILAQPGIDTDVQLIPQGDTLEEQMAWLDEAIEWIDQQTASVIAEVHALERRDDTFRKRDALLSSSPEKKAQVRQEMEALAREYEQEATELEEELEQLLIEREVTELEKEWEPLLIEVDNDHAN